MQLHDKYGDAVHSIALNIDFDSEEGEPTAELKQQVTTTLSEHGITCENMMASTPMESLLDHYGVFSVPVVLVFKDGNVVEKFEGEFSYDQQVHPAIDRALAK